MNEKTWVLSNYTSQATACRHFESKATAIFWVERHFDKRNYTPTWNENEWKTFAGYDSNSNSTQSIMNMFSIFDTWSKAASKRAPHPVPDRRILFKKSLMVLKYPYGSSEAPYTPESQNPFLEKFQIIRSDMCKGFCRIFNISLHRIDYFSPVSSDVG